MPGIPPSRMRNPAFATMVAKMRLAGLADGEIEAQLAKMPALPMGGRSAGDPAAAAPAGVMASSPLQNFDTATSTRARPPGRRDGMGATPPAMTPPAPIMGGQNVAEPPPIMPLQPEDPGGVGFGGGQTDGLAALLAAINPGGGGLAGSPGSDILLPKPGGGFPLGTNASGHGAASPGAGPPGVSGAAPSAGNFLGMSPEIARNLLDFGLATMSAGDKSGASFFGAVGEGGQSALQSKDRRSLREAITKRQDSADKRDERRLQIDEQNASKDPIASTVVGKDGKVYGVTRGGKKVDIGIEGAGAISADKAADTARKLATRKETNAYGGSTDQFDVKIYNEAVSNLGHPEMKISGGGVQEGATATNPTTGAKMIFKGGKWVPQ